MSNGGGSPAMALAGCGTVGIDREHRRPLFGAGAGRVYRRRESFLTLCSSST